MSTTALALTHAVSGPHQGEIASGDQPPARPAHDAASDAACAMAELMPCLMSTQDAQDLLALLEYTLAVPSAAERRHETLGLLVRLIDELGRLPGARAYDKAHAEAAQRGETWPDRSTLIRRYRVFENAEIAAARYLAKGSTSRVPDSYQHATRRPANGTYTPAHGSPVEVIRAGELSRPRIAVEAVIAFRDAHRGTWPVDATEFARWAARQRGQARRKGLPAPNLPSEQLMREYGRFDETVTVAKHWYMARAQKA